MRMHYATICEVERIRHTNLTALLPKKRSLPARSMLANIKLKEMCGFSCLIIKENI